LQQWRRHAKSVTMESPYPSSEDLYVFRSQLLRDGSYQLILPSERARMHALAYNLIEREAAYANTLAGARELALHAGLAATSESPELRHFRGEYLKSLRRWAEHAEAAWDNTDAADAWRAVASHPDCEAPERANAHLRASNALHTAGRHEPAGAELEHVRSVLAECPEGDATTRLRVNERLAAAQLHEEKGEGPAGDDAVEEALRLAETLPDPLLHARVLKQKGHRLRIRGELEAAYEVNRRAVELMREVTEPADVAALGSALSALAISAHELGRHGEYETLSQEAVATARRSGNLSTIGGTAKTAGVAARLAGRAEESLRYLREALEVTRRIGARSTYAGVLTSLANTVIYTPGGMREAEPMMIESLRVLREIGNVSSAATSWNNLAYSWFENGMFRAAEVAYRHTEEHAHRSSYPLLEARAACFRALVLTLLGEFDAARESIAKGHELLRRHDEGKFMLDFGIGTELTVRIALEPEAAEALTDAAIRKAEELTAAIEADTSGQRALNSLETVRSELQRARAEGREPLIFRGMCLESIKPPQRAALCDMLRTEQRGEGERLQSTRPRLWEALHAGLEGVEVPPWNDRTRALSV